MSKHLLLALIMLGGALQLGVAIFGGTLLVKDRHDGTAVIRDVPLAIFALSAGTLLVAIAAAYAVP